ncbi:YwiC-like family protein [Anaerobacillus sp. HL2]|nr:YwiC-like family protein [Anaerobacillus sp. HL2]
MNWFVPREHGAWAMPVVPYLVGMLASNITWLHLPFFIGVMAFYFASRPFLTSVRKPKLRKVAMPAFTIYMCIGSLFTLPILYLIPEIIFIGLLIIPFFIVNIIFAKLKKELSIY